MDKTLTELGKLIKPDNIDTGDISYYGQVVSKVIEDSKVVAYNVKVGDSIIEARRTCGADVGDIVLCTTLNNGLTVVSGKLDGDADVEAALEAAASASEAAEQAVDLVEDFAEDVAEALQTAQDAQDDAEDAITIATEAQQHFWFTSTGTDSGAHITEVNQEDFVRNPSSGGPNLIATTNGVAVRDGLEEYAVFSSGGSRIGKKYVASPHVTNEGRLEQDYHSIRMYDKYNNEVLHVSDLKDRTGVATIRTKFRITSEMTSSPGQSIHIWNNAQSITHAYYGTLSGPTDIDVLNVAITATPTSSDGYVRILADLSVPIYEDSLGELHYLSVGDTIYLDYTTMSDETKAFTFDSRKAPGQTIGPGSASFGNSAAGYRSFSANYGSATGNMSFAEGASSSSGDYSHAEGWGSFSSGDYSHAEGYTTFASGEYSHAEGYNTRAAGDYSHAEGYNTKATGTYSHAEGGYGTEAIGDYSHAGGYYTVIEPDYSFAHGQGLTINPRSPNGAAAFGKWNDPMTGSLFAVGCGTFDDDRRNAFEIDEQGYVKDFRMAGGAGIRVGINSLDATIGTIRTASPSQSVASATDFSSLGNAYLTLSRGIWIVTYSCYCDVNSAGKRLAARLYNLDLDTAYTSSRAITHTQSTAAVAVTGSIPIEAGEGDRIYLQAYQNSGSARTISGYLRAVKICTILE